MILPLKLNMEEKTNVSDVSVSAEAIELVLNRVLEAHKPDIETWRKEQEAKFESNIIMIDPEKFVALLDISFITQDRWDGCNGYYDMKPQDYARTMEAFGEKINHDSSLFSTKQGLEKIYRFQLKINEVPAEKMYQYRIVRASDAEGVGYFVSGLSPIQSLEFRMRRKGIE